jgi:uncharacterized membrane protein SirB2
MDDQILNFLLQKYGNRVDRNQPLDSCDKQTITKQLKLVESQIGTTRMFGIVWIVFGFLWLTISGFSIFTSTLDWLNIGKVAVGISYLLLGFFYFLQSAELKRKKVILETILLIKRENG